MRITTPLMTLAAGMVAGAFFVLSCGDDSPGNADAAMCDCTAAEPSIRGRIMVVSQIQTIPANDRGGQGAECPQGALRLSGSCTTQDVNPVRDVTLEQAGFHSADNLRSWSCDFRNNEATPVTIKASVVCLLPASS